MEAIGVDRGINGTGWQARGVPELFKAELWQEISLDKVLAGEKEAADLRQDCAGRPPVCATEEERPVASTRCAKGKDRAEPDRYARPHHGARALSAVQIRSRAQETPLPPRQGDAPTPDGRTRVISRCVLRFIHPRSGGITATSSSTTTGWTGATYEEPVT